MAAGIPSHVEPTSRSESNRGPEITVCESRPGRSVFLESGNTEGWIASDLTVEVPR
ncbi:hypothetical protein [Halobellus rubicundus]|uniref:SH3 domain-containing protein n=1 Tax=Halobellus rubicundus TaxID=2996466 RepID=A0ABD5MF49_9EURY